METYILRALRGDHEAFAQLYDHYGERALRLSMSITQNRQMAEDAVQETFLRIYRKGHQFKKSEKFEPWLFRIVINESKRCLMKQPPTVELDRDIPMVTSFDETIGLNLAMGQALNALSEEHRTVLSLKFLLDYSEAEIARVIERPVGTVKSRLHYAKRAMAQIMRGGEAQ